MFLLLEAFESNIIIIISYGNYLKWLYAFNLVHFVCFWIVSYCKSSVISKIKNI